MPRIRSDFSPKGGALAVQPLSQGEFESFRRFLDRAAGIRLTERNRVLVETRLGRRLRHYGFTRFEEYFHYATDSGHGDEQQKMLDLLTTNETYFFREPEHFNFLRNQIVPGVSATDHFAVWSAAASSGEEAYSTAIILAENLRRNNWSILGTDINNDVLRQASSGKYPIEYRGNIPDNFLKRYFLKGYDQEMGKMLVCRELRSHTEFRQFNLNAERWQYLPNFDLIFLRNVMIYFEMETKLALVKKISAHLKPGGYLMIGSSEAMPGDGAGLKRVTPSIYRKAG